MPKVLRIINRLNLGGPTFNVAYLSKYLQPEFETILVSGMKENSEESSDFILQEMGITPVYIPEMYREIDPLNDRKAYKKIKALIHDFKPDIVHTHAAKAGALGRLAAINSKVPVILHTFHGHVFHSYFGKAKTRFFLEVERYLAKNSSGIVSISEQLKTELCIQYKIDTPARTFVVPLGFDLKRFSENRDQKRLAFRKQWGIKDHEIAIGLVGRLVPIKNHELFLRGVSALLKRTEKPLKAIIVGDGELRNQLEQLVDELALRDYVVFTSWIKEIDVVCAGIDIMALTSLNEGTPVSIIEAMSAQKPVICSNVGGVGDLIQHQKTGLLFESKNQEDFLQQLLFAIENPDDVALYAKNAQFYATENYSYQHLVKSMSALYYQLLKQ